MRGLEIRRFRCLSLGYDLGCDVFSSTHFSISLPISFYLRQMYTVGPDYGHAEARKSPAVDGKVERNDDGKEVRFPVILTLREKEIARR